MKFLMLLFSIGLFTGSGYSQTTNKTVIDSLLTVIHSTKSDTIKVKNYMKIEYSYRFSDPKKGLLYADTALALAKKINWTKGLAITYNNIGNNYLDRGIHTKALEYYHHSLEFSKELPKYRQISLMNISNIYLREKNYDLSRQYITESYKVSKAMKSDENIAFCKYQMGLIDRDENKLDTARKNFKESLHYFRAHNNTFQIAEITNFLGGIEKNYDKKLDYLLESKAIWDQIAPDYVSAINNAASIAGAYLSIAKGENTISNPKYKTDNSTLLTEAEQLLLKGLQLAKTSNSTDNLLTIYSHLAGLYRLNNNSEKALEYLNAHYTLKDSVFSQENKNEIARLESQKEIELRDKELELNQLTLETKEKQKWYFIGGIILLTIIGGLLFYQNRNRKITNKKLLLLNTELDEANKTKARFFSILNHDLRSPVSNLISFIHLQKESPELLDEESKKRIQDKTISGAENLLQSMEDILEWSKSQMQNFKPEYKHFKISSLFKNIQNHFSSIENVTLFFENPENIGIITDKDYLKAIIRNLTGNAIKASESNQNPVIKWKVWQENGKTFVSVSDNGTGVSKEELKALYDDTEVVGIKKGLGLHVIRDLARAINCEILVNSTPHEGTTFTLILK